MAMRDRFRELPNDVLDHILGLLPIQEAARNAILSTVWRDVWLSLSQLKFDNAFFSYIRDRYFAEAAFHVVNKVLVKHVGPIRSFVFNFDIQRRGDRFRWFDFDQWLLFLTQNGIEEVFLSFGHHSTVLLPDFIFSCPTLKRLYLHGVFVEPVNAPSIFPNLTSLRLEYARFDSRNLVAFPATLPMLETLTCGNISDFNITAPKLRSLKTNSWGGDLVLPANLDLKPIRSLNLWGSSLQYLVKGLSRMGQDQTALNVEYLKLGLDEDKCISTFIHLLQMCPKLCKLDIQLHRGEATSIDDLLKHPKDIVAQTCKKVRALSIICSFDGSMPKMRCIEWFVTLFPTLEKIVFNQWNVFVRTDTQLKYKDKLLRFLRASSNAEIAYIY